MYCVTVVARLSHITIDDNKFSITKCDAVNLYTIDYVWIDINFVRSREKGGVQVMVVVLVV